MSARAQPTDMAASAPEIGGAPRDALSVYDPKTYEDVRMASDWRLRQSQQQQQQQQRQQQHKRGGGAADSAGAAPEESYEKLKEFNRRLARSEAAEARGRREHEATSRRMDSLFARSAALQREQLLPLAEQDARERARRRAAHHHRYETEVFLPIQREIDAQVASKTATDYRRVFGAVKQNNFELRDSEQLARSRSRSRGATARSAGAASDGGAPGGEEERTWKEKKDALWLSYISETNHQRLVNQKYTTSNNNGVFLDIINEENNYDPIKQMRKDTIYYTAGGKKKKKGGGGGGDAGGGSARRGNIWVQDDSEQRLVDRYNRLGVRFRERAGDKNSLNPVLCPPAQSGGTINSGTGGHAANPPTVCTKSRDLPNSRTSSSSNLLLLAGGGGDMGGGGGRSGSLFSVFGGGGEEEEEENLEHNYANTNNFFIPAAAPVAGASEAGGSAAGGSVGGSANGANSATTTTGGGVISLPRTVVPFDFEQTKNWTPAEAAAAMTSGEAIADPRTTRRRANRGGDGRNRNGTDGGGGTDGAAAGGAKHIPPNSFLRKQSRAALSIGRVERSIAGTTPGATINDNNNNSSSVAAPPRTLPPAAGDVMPPVTLPSAVSPQQQHNARLENRVFAKDRIHQYHGADRAGGERTAYNLPVRQWAAPQLRSTFYTHHMLPDGSAKALCYDPPAEGGRTSDFSDRQRYGGAAMVESSVPLFTCNFGDRVPPDTHTGKRMDIWL